jgi:hypothetical protein
MPSFPEAWFNSSVGEIEPRISDSGRVHSKEVTLSLNCGSKHKKFAGDGHVAWESGFPETT